MHFSELMGFLWPRKTLLAVALTALIGESLLALATPWLAGRFTQGLLGGDLFWGLTLNGILGLWLVILAAQALLRFISSSRLTQGGASILAELSVRVYEHLQALPVTFHTNRRKGELLALLSNDIATLSHFVTGTLVSLIPLLLTLFGALALMARIDASMAVLTAVLLPAFFLMVKVLGRSLRPVTDALMREQADALAIAEENLGFLPIIKAFTREDPESRRFRDQTLAVLRLRTRQLRLQAALGPTVQFAAGAAVLSLLWVSSRGLAEGRIAAADLVSLLLYGLLLARPVSNLAEVYGEVQQARGASARLLAVMAEQPEPLSAGTELTTRSDGAIEFRDVSFHYPDRPSLLRNLCLTVSPGETVAITGSNGAGKTTLAHLLMRFVDPVEGAVFLDGQDLHGLSLASLRRQIGYVAQHVLLANDTVGANIGYGRPDSDPAAIREAARLAHGAEFIARLPQGYDTRVGEGGVRLSGGQRQRIALARALLKDPPILVLDEATAMFDPEGERALIDECREVLSTRTVLLITHRPASLALADRILRLENGKLTEIARRDIVTA